MKSAKRVWRWSFYTRIIAFRYLLTPFGTISWSYRSDDGALTYRDYYIFGIRIARIHKA